MKKFILLALITFCFFKCSPDKNKEEPIETVLEISATELLFSANEEIKSFDIESNESWSITQIPEWLTVDLSEGNGDREITIKASANPKEEERSAVLKISIKDKSKELKVRQTAKNVTLSLSKSEILFPAEPTTKIISFDIASNEAWIISNIPEWCTFNVNKGNGSATVTVLAEKNYIDSEREAVIQVKAGSKTEELKLKQEALNIMLSFTSMDLSSWTDEKSIATTAYSEATVKYVMIRSNTKWSVASDAIWVKTDKDSGFETESITLNIAENTSSADRNAKITITAGSKSLTVIVLQGRLEDVPDDNPYQINLRDNAPHIGDELIKKQVEYVDPGDAGENITWNFSNLQILNDNYQVSYSESPLINGNYYVLGDKKFDKNQTETNSLFVCTEFYTEYYFQIKDDKLLEVGHENSVTILDYNPMPVAEIYPSYYNSYYKGDYQSTYWYSATIPGATKGYKEVKADGYGTIVLPTGTYTNAIRIKYTETIQEMQVAGGGVFTNPDEIDEYTIYKWYVKGYRYPVFETHRIINTLDDSEIFSTAFYYPPTDQTYLKSARKSEIISKSYTLKKSVKLTQAEGILPILQMKRKNIPH
ncbi:MAG: BACON domain-containing protein [Candidatus Azobacteroides sp.]|nr:BACON domain-containing protein [Candidatus Azobacteroides sp.]